MSTKKTGLIEPFGQVYTPQSMQFVDNHQCGVAWMRMCVLVTPNTLVGFCCAVSEFMRPMQPMVFHKLQRGE